MWDAIQLMSILSFYAVATYFLIKFILKFIVDLKPYFRLLILSFLYALFWGIGIAGSDGHPGFAFPVPNIIALGIMVCIGFYRGVFTTGLYLLIFWWTIIFLAMLIGYFIKRKKGSI